MKEQTRNRFSFEWLVTLTSPIGMGLAAAFVFSIESVNPNVQFALTWKTWASLGIVAWLTFLGCRALFFTRDSDQASASRRQRRWFLGITAISIGGTFAAMAYSLRGVSQEKLTDVGFGVLLAAFALSIVAFLFLRTVQFLQMDERENALSVNDGQSH